MTHTLILLFRRDPSRDRQRERIRYLGYRPCWPDGRAVTIGLDVLCQHGQRLLGLNRHLAHRTECLIRLMRFPVADFEEPIQRLPGHRVRRFFLERHGRMGRIHFMDGTPTDVVFHLDQDEPEVLDWLGLSELKDGERGWFDLAAGLAEETLENGNGERIGHERDKVRRNGAAKKEVAESLAR